MHSPITRGHIIHFEDITFQGQGRSLSSGLLSPKRNVTTLWLFTFWLISFSSLSYDRSKASSKASSPHSAIQSFLLQMNPLLPLRSSNSFLRLLTCLPVTSIPPYIYMCIYIYIYFVEQTLFLSICNIVTTCTNPPRPTGGCTLHLIWYFLLTTGCSEPPRLLGVEVPV